MRHNVLNEEKCGKDNISELQIKDSLNKQKIYLYKEINITHLKISN